MNEDVSEKVFRMLSDKFQELRKNVSAKEMMDKISDSLDSLRPLGVSMDVSGVDIDMSIVAELFEKFNDSHKEKVLELANSIGAVVEESHVPDEDHLLVKVDDINLNIKKDLALKIVALGYVPDCV
jgi:hypothetical protein